MAVSTTDIKTALLNCGSGVTTFPFSFKILEDSDLKVYLINSAGVRELLGLPSDYSVSAVNDDFSEGGNVETVATYASGNKILIVRAVTNKQESDYTHGDDLPADTLEDDFDRRCMVEQEQIEHINRALCFPVEDDPDLDPELPPAADRLGKYLYFDATNGEPVMVDILEPAGALAVTEFAETILDKDDAAGVLTALGITDFVQTLFDDADADEILRTLTYLTSIKAVDGADYVGLDDDGYTVINFTNGAVNRTYTCPTAADNIGRKLTIRKADDGAGYVILDGEGAETINGTTLWYLFDQYDHVVIECDGTEWFVVGGTEPGLEYIHIADWSQTTAAQNTWYAVTDFILALPTGGVWDIEIGTHQFTNGEMTEVTCSDGSATENDDKYTMNTSGVASTYDNRMTTKSFRRTFAAAATLYINCRTVTGGTPTINIKDANAHGYVRARRIR